MPKRFLLQTPTDMLAKAHREIEAMRADLNTDTVFNTFVTLYHVMDYVKTVESVDEQAIEAMYRDEDFDICRLICNQGKHLKLDRDSRVAREEEVLYAYGDEAFGERAYGGRNWYLGIEGRQVRPLQLAEDVYAKWEEFFRQEGLDLPQADD